MKRVYFYLITIIIIILSFIAFYFDNKNIQIAFIGSLSGKYLVLGNSVVKGIKLALEEQNYKLGGKKIDLIIKDNNSNKERNNKIIKDFIKDDIKIVLGNITSSMTKESLATINKEKNIILFSPTASSNEFSGIDDNFFRIYTPNSRKKFKELIEIFKKKSYKRNYIIYDQENESYTKNYASLYEQEYKSQDKNAVFRGVTFKNNYNALVNEIKQFDADIVFIATNTIDTAKIIQYLKLKKLNKQVVVSGWAFTSTLIENCGQACNGVLSVISYEKNSKKDEYINFVKKYEKRYKEKPSFYTLKGYELIKILDKVLKIANEDNVKKAILKIKRFDGLLGEIVFDKYGDIYNKTKIYMIKNGEFKVINDR